MLFKSKSTVGYINNKQYLSWRAWETFASSINHCRSQRLRVRQTHTRPLQFVPWPSPHYVTLYSCTHDQRNECIVPTTAPTNAFLSDWVSFVEFFCHGFFYDSLASFLCLLRLLPSGYWSPWDRSWTGTVPHTLLRWLRSELQIYRSVML